MAGGLSPLYRHGGLRDLPTVGLWGRALWFPGWGLVWKTGVSFPTPVGLHSLLCVIGTRMSILEGGSVRSPMRSALTVLQLA